MLQDSQVLSRNVFPRLDGIIVVFAQIDSKCFSINRLLVFKCVMEVVEPFFGWYQNRKPLEN